MTQLVIGLTGGIGSGKTTIANMFGDLGVDLIDADIVAREVVAPNSEALITIKDRFGDDFILPDGELDRTKLRHQIFNSEEDKQWLNNLLHPLIRQSLLAQINEPRSSYCILIAPLLIENGLVEYVDRVLVIDVCEEVQIERTILRDNSNKSTIESIIKSQIPRKERLTAADDIIDNSTNDFSAIKQRVSSLHQSYIDAYNSKN